MLPISEIDLEVKGAVEKIVGICTCGDMWKGRWKGDISDENMRDPDCRYHELGEEFAILIRDNRRLESKLQRIHHQTRKAPK